LGATIDRLAPSNSQYRENAKASLKNLGAAHAGNIPVLAGILKALRADYAAGYLQRVEQLVQADLFADFLEMAEHLLDQGYKDPSAVLAGGVLEEQLRKLCLQNEDPQCQVPRRHAAHRLGHDRGCRFACELEFQAHRPPREDSPLQRGQRRIGLSGAEHPFPEGGDHV
jgi:hypothetical protein